MVRDHDHWAWPEPLALLDVSLLLTTMRRPETAVRQSKGRAALLIEERGPAPCTSIYCPDRSGFGSSTETRAVDIGRVAVAFVSEGRGGQDMTVHLAGSPPCVTCRLAMPKRDQRKWTTCLPTPM